MIRLNLACGTDLRDDWINLDVVRRWPLASRPCDVIWDARTDELPFPEGSVEEVYAGYLFLHLAPQHHLRVIREIYRVLRDGGRLIVGEVDMAVLLPRWLEHPEDPYLSGLLWGEQGASPPRECETCRELARLANQNQRAGYMPCGACLLDEEQRKLEQFDKHCHGFTEMTLRCLLASGGFPIARRGKIHGDEVWYELTLETFKGA